MDRTSDAAIEIINELRANSLIRSNEYVPLIDCANQCEDYEDTGLTPERCVELSLELDSTKQQLKAANECIAVCAEAFFDRCHDDYAEEAIEKWEKT